MAVSTSQVARAYTSMIAEIRAEAEDWRVTPRSARAIFVAPVLACAAVAATVLHRPFFDFLTAEDSVVEWLQWIGFFSAAALGAIVAVRLRSDHRTMALLFAVFALGNLFISGEEIAWGQRILGLETPDALESVNHQGEITLHNITKGFSLQFAFNLCVLVIGLVGAMIPWVVRRKGLLSTSDTKLLITPLFLTSAFLMAGGYRLARLVVFPSPRFVIVRYGEITELCLAFGLALFAFLSMRRLTPTEPDATH